MSFHQLEATAVLQDATDNQRLSQILQHYRQLQQKYSFAQKQIEQLTAEVTSLKELQKVQKESAKHYHSHSLSPKHNISLKEANIHTLTFPFPPEIHAQQTKRKVINGFVAELTNELESSEQLLASERRMHEELRRSLQLSHQQVLALKSANRTLEIQLASLASENRQLMGEVGELQGRREALEGQAERTAVRQGWQRELLLRRAQQAEEEFLLMDRIYHQIQIEIASK